MGVSEQIVPILMGIQQISTVVETYLYRRGFLLVYVGFK